MIRELQPDILINDRLPGGDYDHAGAGDPGRPSPTGAGRRA